MQDIIEQIRYKVTEDYEYFIFKIIQPYCEEVTEMKISKKLLVRALLEYKENHPEVMERMKHEMSEM